MLDVTGHEVITVTLISDEGVSERTTMHSLSQEADERTMNIVGSVASMSVGQALSKTTALDELCKLYNQLDHLSKYKTVKRERLLRRESALVQQINRQLAEAQNPFGAPFSYRVEEIVEN